MSRIDHDERARELRLLERTLGQLKSMESDMSVRLGRLEENLRLLRQDLIGNGQPGRIAQIEGEMGLIRAEYHRQRGILAAISVFVSTGVALLAHFLGRD
jgi:hypothetical protein